MTRSRQVAVLIPLERAHLTRLLRGITDYAEKHGQWSFHVNPEQPNASVHVLEGWDGDGALALVDRAADAKAARQLELPVVNLSTAMNSLLQEDGIARAG